MSQWLELISTVRFDLEEGPVVDFSFPSQNFSQDFIKKLAYPAFPDSYTLLCDDKMFFSFMIKAKKIDRLTKTIPRIIICRQSILFGLSLIFSISFS